MPIHRAGFEVDAFCIGAPRSATTWFLRCLAEHPGVTVSDPKEPNHFVRVAQCFLDAQEPRFLADPEAYKACFRHARPGDVLVDGSVTLMSNTDTAPRLLHEHNPDAKLLVLLRDPIARAYSNYWHDTTLVQPGDVPATFQKALYNRRLVGRSRYHEQLVEWGAIFPREQMHVMLDLDIRDDPARVMSEAFHFLGVDDGYEPPGLGVRVNAPQRRRGVMDRAYAMGERARSAGLGWLVESVKAVGVETALQKHEHVPLKVPPIDAEDAACMLGLVDDDIARLEEWLHRDLSPWRERWLTA